MTRATQTGADWSEHLVGCALKLPDNLCVVLLVQGGTAVQLLKLQLPGDLAPAARLQPAVVPPGGQCGSVSPSLRVVSCCVAAAVAGDRATAPEVCWRGEGVTVWASYRRKWCDSVCAELLLTC